MAIHQLSGHFASFFGRLNPSSSFEATASSQYATIKGLIEDRSGPAAALSPICFLQGSYKQQTAIYAINDVDIVVLCSLWQPGSGGVGTASYGRDRIFDVIAAPLRADKRYASKIRYGPTSMCIKVDMSIKVEILPVVHKAGTTDSSAEPFRLYRPNTVTWEDGYARYHQQWLTLKNSAARTSGNFIPMIKALKHLRSQFGPPAVSFHLECLLYSVPDECFRGSGSEYIPAVLNYIAGYTADAWSQAALKTPCGERTYISAAEWDLARWRLFHQSVCTWANIAKLAADAADRSLAIKYWQIALGENYFPNQPSA